MTIIDLFAGPGGWSEALTSLNHSEIGLEWDSKAIDTARAAGHIRVNADISKTEPSNYEARGLIGSPPCQAFSNAGKGLGRKNLNLVSFGMKKIHQGAGIEIIDELGQNCGDIRAGLVVSPLIWARQLKPDWIALEQVATVLPAWKEMAKYLALEGYDVEVSLLNSADFGVAQSRRRAILVAKKGGVSLPVGTSKRLSVHDVLPSSKEYTHIKHNAGHRARPRVDGKQIVNTPQGDYYQRFDLSLPSPTLTTQLSAWKFDSPERISDMMWKTSEDSRQITIEEFSTIQSFRSDYPWQGTKGDIHRQIGDTIPPKLAAAILEKLL